jgi:curved DNA-binding protein CbpA
MAHNTGRVQSKLYRLACIGGAAAFFFPVFEPFLPLIITVAGSIVLGCLTRFIFSLLINKNLNQSYRTYTSSCAGAADSADGSINSRNGKTIPPPQPEDPLKPYRALFGLPPGFSQGQLKSAYRSLAAQYHPDRYESAPAKERQNAEEMMKKINDTYNVLYAAGAKKQTNYMEENPVSDSVFSLYPYPPDDLPKKRRLDSLMDDWKKQLAPYQVLFRDDGKLYPAESFFAADGFLPYYFHQKHKVLFIARETRYIAGQDNIEVILKKCKDKPQGISAESVLRRMLLLAYGIQNGGTVPFENIDPQKLCFLAATAEGFSFAFMELSKYSNENDDGATADTELMSSFFEHSRLQKRNFIQEELSLLDPGLVITMNLWDGKINPGILRLALGDAPFIDCPHPSAARRSMSINGNKVPVIDLYHFSSRKSDRDDFYDPVMGIIIIEYWPGHE